MKMTTQQNKSLVLPKLVADSPWKKILDVYLKEYLEFCLPDLAKNIDWRKGYLSLDKEFQKISVVSQVKNKIVDKVIKVWSMDGSEKWLLIHLEVQTWKDPDFSERMFIYYYRLFDRYKKSIISIAMLIDNDPYWRPKSYVASQWGCCIELNFLMVKLLDYREICEDVKKIKNPFILIILAQLKAIETRKDLAGRLKIKIALTKQLFQCALEKQQILSIFEFIDWLISLPDNLEVEYNQEVNKIAEEKQMAFISTPQRVGMAIGLQQGLEQGLQQGIERGMEKGVKKGQEKLFVRQLILRFKKIPLNYLQRIKQADEKTLLNWAEKILTASTLEEIFD